MTDPGLKRYINLHSMIVPHSSGKFTKQQFAKGEMLIVERLINRLMQTEMNTGQKQRAIRITKDAFETIYKKTKKNPSRSSWMPSPRQAPARRRSGSSTAHQCPQVRGYRPPRRVNSALMFISLGVLAASHKNKKDVSDCLADELIAAHEATRSAIP